MKVALQVMGKYVSAENGGDMIGIVHANRTEIGAWETWDAEQRVGNVYAFKSFNGRYLSAEGGGGGEVHANRLVVGPWECWTVQDLGMMSENGHWLCAEQNLPSIPVNATRSTAGDWEAVHLIPLGEARQLLHIDGTRFSYADGTDWTWRGVSDFRLLKRFLDGEDIVPLLQARKALGANLVRVLAMARNLFDLNPSTIAAHTYYDGVHAFLELVSQQQLRCELVALADAQYLMSDLIVQKAHVGQLSVLLNNGPHMGELVNEYFKNGVDPTKFDKPAGLWSRGSFVDGDIPHWVGWDFHTWHGRRDGYKAMLSSADPLLEMHLGVDWAKTLGARAAVHDEPVKFTSQCGDPRVAYVLGVTSSLYGNGATFHSDEGLQSLPFSAETARCAESFMRGLTVGAQR